MRIAVFDHFVVPTSPSGKCILYMLEGLCREHEFTVFAARLENPCPERILFVRIPVPLRPNVLRFVCYHLVAPVTYWMHRLRTGARFDLVYVSDICLSFGELNHAHFCNRSYLKHEWKQARPRNLRGLAHWLNHWLRALMEPHVFRRVRHIVVPSKGLERELASEYAFASDKIHRIPNAIDLGHMLPASDFDRVAFRKSIGLAPEQVVFVFVALGHFERKGLSVVLEALRVLGKLCVKLLVVGGPPDLVRGYRNRAQGLGVEGQVLFVGMQEDVRPYLWASDAFLFPSIYEIFPLVSLEAAAVGLPLLLTPLYGVEEFFREGENGFRLERTPQGVAQGIRRFLQMSERERQAMGARARESVRVFDVARFVHNWRDLLDTIEMR